MKSGIYKITNPNNKSYIGKAVNLSRRKNSYRGMFCDTQPKIYNSLKKYGWEQHIFEVIEECSVDMLVEREIYHKTEFIEKYGWDMALFINIVDEIGGKFTDETKRKISQSKKGHKCYTDEWRLKISNSLNERNHSQYYTEEVKSKISNALKGKSKVFTQEHLDNLSKANLESKGKIVECYDLSNKFIQEFSCLREAKTWLLNEKNLHSPNIDKQIKDCCTGRQKTCHGFKFKYKIK